MLLTLKPPIQSELSRPNPHVYSPPRTEPPKLHSPTDSKVGALSLLSDPQSQRMGTSHRLPPPLGMTLPNPTQDRGPPPPPPPPSLGQSQTMGHLPPPPTSQWQGTEDSMRNWLAAKSEEDKRKQEEERTRQEGLRLEQRKIEQSMLRESLQGGVPPHMVPIVFAGMGGAALAHQSLEWAQQWISQMSLNSQPQQAPLPPHQQQQQQQQQPPPPPLQQQQQQHQQQPHYQPAPQQQALPPPPAQTSPDLRRDRGNQGPQPNPYAAHQPQPPPQQPSYAFDRLRGSQVQQSIQAAPGPTSAPRAPSGLSRLNTGEMQIHQPPAAGAPLPVQHSGPQPHGPTSQQEQAQSTPTSIYFHHWVPPNSNKEPATPSGKL